MYTIGHVARKHPQTEQDKDKNGKFD